MYNLLKKKMLNLMKYLPTDFFLNIALKLYNIEMRKVNKITSIFSLNVLKECANKNLHNLLNKGV